MTTLAQIPTERKPLAEPLSEAWIDHPTVGASTTGGAIVIRIGLAGSYSMQILAESSAEE